MVGYAHKRLSPRATNIDQERTSCCHDSAIHSMKAPTAPFLSLYVLSEASLETIVAMTTELLDRRR